MATGCGTCSVTVSMTVSVMFSVPATDAPHDPSGAFELGTGSVGTNTRSPPVPAFGTPAVAEPPFAVTAPPAPSRPRPLPLLAPGEHAPARMREAKKTRCQGMDDVDSIRIRAL